MKNKVIQTKCLSSACLYFFFLLIKPALNKLDKLDDVVTELLIRKKIKCDQHNAASSLYFFLKPIINNFYFRNIECRL